MKLQSIVLVASLCLGGCSLSRPAAERHSFLLLPQHPSVSSQTVSEGRLKVRQVRVVAPFEGRSFVYRRGDQRFESDFYNEFGSDPEEMIAAALVDWMRRGGRFSGVLAPQDAGGGDTVLDVSVQELYVDFRAAPSAVVALTWHLERPGNPVKEGAAEEKVELAARNPGAAAKALQDALALALARLESAAAP